MRKIIVIMGAFLVTSCGVLTPMSEKEKELEYKTKSYTILINQHKEIYEILRYFA